MPLKPPQAVAPEEISADESREIEGALHDVANALTVVLGWLDVAAEEVTSEGTAAEALEFARDRCRHARVLALRTIGAGEPADDLAVGCDVFARNAAASIQPQARRRGVSIRVATGGDLADLAVRSPVRALQVLTNLLLNAVTHAPKDSEVVLEVSRSSPEAVRLVVGDEGPGFEKEKRSRIFDGIASTKRKGRGIGLRYSHWVTEREGGKLRLLDTTRGAKFELLWPSGSPSSRPANRAPETGGLRGKRVLVVEDDPAVVTLLETALGARGAEVTSAADERALGELLDSRTFDAALVDLSPIEGDLRQVLERIRGERPGTRLVLISGSARPPNAAALEVASAWVRKPFEIRDVVAALEGDGGSGT